MDSKKDLNSAELETMRTSRSPTTVMTANGEVQKREEATENVKEFDFFVTVMLLEGTPAVLSLEELCEDHGYTYHWTSGQKPHLIRNGKRIDCKIFKLCVIRGPWFIYEFLWNVHTYFIIIFITGFCIWCQQIHRNSSTRKKWKYEWRASGRQAAWIHRNRKQKSKWGVEHELLDWLQEFRENVVDESTSTEPSWNPELGYRDTSKIISWTFNGAATKSGTRFG